MAELREKYAVTRLYSEDPEEKESPARNKSLLNSVDVTDGGSPFVMMPQKDYAAFRAVAFYAELCEPELGNSIRNWLKTVADEGMFLGTQGQRNMTASMDDILGELDIDETGVMQAAMKPKAKPKAKVEPEEKLSEA